MGKTMQSLWIWQALLYKLAVVMSTLNVYLYPIPDAIDTTLTELNNLQTKSCPKCLISLTTVSQTTSRSHLASSLSRNLFVIGEDDPQGVHIAFFFFLIPQEQYIFLAFLFVNYLVWLSYRNQGWTDKLLFGRMEGREVLMFKQHLYRFPFSHGVLYTATTSDILKKDKACPLVSVPVKTINI